MTDTPQDNDIDAILEELHKPCTKPTYPGQKANKRKLAKQAINQKIQAEVVARIDELLYLTNHADPMVLDRAWIRNRIKAIDPTNVTKEGSDV